MTNHSNLTRDSFCDYLNEEFSDPKKVEATLSALWLEKFGVMVKKKGDLYLFKYNQLRAKWMEPLTHQCRGPIFRYYDGLWVRLTRPFDKFFNQSEGHCPFFNEAAFNQSLPQFSLTEKADGTCIQVWFDSNTFLWRISTLGSIETTSMGDCGLTFGQLFERALGGSVADLGAHLCQQTTYIFELCTEENRIVTGYNIDTVFLLGARDVASGNHLPESRLAEHVSNWSTVGFNVRSPHSFSALETGLTTLGEVKCFVEDQSQDFSRYGENPEGFIIYHRGAPVAKMKNCLYLVLHRRAGAPSQTMEYVLEALFNETLDDVAGALPAAAQEFAPFARGAAAHLLGELQRAVRQVLALPGVHSERDLALAIPGAVADRRFRPFFFRAKAEFVAALQGRAAPTGAAAAREEEEELARRAERWFVDSRARFYQDIKGGYAKARAGEGPAPAADVDMAAVLAAPPEATVAADRKLKKNRRAAKKKNTSNTAAEKSKASSSGGSNSCLGVLSWS